MLQPVAGIATIFTFTHMLPGTVGRSPGWTGRRSTSHPQRGRVLVVRRVNGAVTWIFVERRTMFCEFKQRNIHPGRLTAGTYKSHMKRKEDDLPILHDYVPLFHVNLQGCIHFKVFTLQEEVNHLQKC